MSVAVLSKRSFLLCVLLALCGAGGFFVYAWESQMSARVMMYYGPWSPEEKRFDASQWFRSGMYRPRLMGIPAEASPETMLRVEPERFRSAQNREILARVLLALEERYPDVDTEDLILNTPDLSRRIRYAYSWFEEPNKPHDTYWLFLPLEGRQYVITIEWDVTEKKLTSSTTAQLMSKDSDAEIEYRKVLKELDEATNKR
jgi:hypothetical protein